MNNNNISLESAIRVLKKPSLSDDKKLSMKLNIMDNIDASLTYGIKAVVQGFVLDSYKRAKVKERVFSSIDNYIVSKINWTNFFGFHKKLLSGMLLVMMVFSFAVFINVDMNVVRAQTFTTLDEFSGTVVVQRDGIYMDLKGGMKILEKDKIVTGNDGKATVRFFDDSLTRLSADTSLHIDSLVRPDNSSVRSYVEVDLSRGTLWGYVMNLQETNSSFVVDTNDAKVTAEKAAFNISVIDDEVSVGVFNDSLTVNGSGSDNTIVSGQKVVLKPSERIVRVEAIDDVERSLAWVKDNLNNDEKYVLHVEKKLIAAKAYSVGFNPKDEIPVNTNLREDTVLFLTFNGIKKKQKQLDLAEKRFVSAQVKLDAGEVISEEDIAKVKKTFDDFSEQSNKFSELIDSVRITDANFADELSLYLHDKLLANKHDLAVVAGGVLPAVDVAVSDVATSPATVSDVGVVGEDDASIAIAVPKPVEPISDVPRVVIKKYVEERPISLEDKLKSDSEKFGVGVKGDKPLSPLFNVE